MPGDPTPAEVRINLNATVTVRLTSKGREMVDAYYSGYAVTLPAVGEPYSDSLWSLMHIFGPALTMGARPVIEGLTFTAPVGGCVEVVDPEAERLRAENQRLQTALDHAIGAGFVAVNEALAERDEARTRVAELERHVGSLHKAAAAGRDAEREAVVRWLMREPVDDDFENTADLADAIERGEHREREGL